MNPVHLLDLHFQDTPGVIASSTFDTGDGLALVDVGPTTTLPALEAGLRELGASLKDVRHLLLTHIHFDHAGAAGVILDRVPRARAYVHERGAPHLSRPERLVASATQIYGDQMDRLWGELRPIAPDRMTVLEGDSTLQLGSAEVRVLYTPGHAVHHVAYAAGDELFLGDVGGVRLSAAQTPRAPTPPPDIDLEAWRDSVARLRALDARTLHLAHFGSYTNEPAHWEGLLHTMAHDAEFVQARRAQGEDIDRITPEFTERLLAQLEGEGADLPARFEFACPPWMSVQGLMRYWKRRDTRRTAGEG